MQDQSVAEAGLPCFNQFRFYNLYKKSIGVKIRFQIVFTTKTAFQSGGAVRSRRERGLAAGKGKVTLASHVLLGQEAPPQSRAGEAHEKRNKSKEPKSNPRTLFKANCLTFKIRSSLVV